MCGDASLPYSGGKFKLISIYGKEIQITPEVKYDYASARWISFIILVIANDGKNRDQQDSHSLLVGMQNHSVTLENNLAVSYKAIHTLTMWFNNDIFKYFSRDMKTYFHTGTNSQKHADHSAVLSQN